MVVEQQGLLVQLLLKSALPGQRLVLEPQRLLVLFLNEKKKIRTKITTETLRTAFDFQFTSSVLKVSECGNIRFIFNNNANQFADGHIFFAGLNQYFRQVALFRRFEAHRCFIGLNFGQQITCKSKSYSIFTIFISQFPSDKDMLQHHFWNTLFVIRVAATDAKSLFFSHSVTQFKSFTFIQFVADFLLPADNCSSFHGWR